MDLKQTPRSTDSPPRVEAAPNEPDAHSPPALDSFGSGPLALLSLPEQLQWISEQLDQLERRCPFSQAHRIAWLSTELSGLVGVCIRLLDSAPLAHLIRLLCDRGLLNEGPDWDTALGQDGQRESGFASLIALLSTAPDTFLLKLVRVLIEVVANSGEALSPQQSAAVVLARLQTSLPFTRLPARCVVDRALQRHFPLLRARLLTAAQGRILTWARRGVPSAGGSEQTSPPLHALADFSHAGFPLEDASLCSHAQLVALVSAAEGPARLRLNALKQHLASCTLEVLASQPRGVSQANAEELLSRRVYTDPGHFLIELLQNAEDACAHSWSVRFEPERVVVAHDGQPFDCRDVVGVTSIGQTTKVQQQIGMFGVGFKSVYEVTQRPRIRSGDFAFELVDVSVPRAIEPSMLGFPSSWTVIELPLANPEDQNRTAARLYERACQLDPCVLLTLRNLQQVELSLVGSVASSRRIRRILESEQVQSFSAAAMRGSELQAGQPSALGAESTLRLAKYSLEMQENSIAPSLQPSSLGEALSAAQAYRRPYLLLESWRTCDRTLREPERRSVETETTRIVLGFELDACGLPQPLQADAAQLFSWLPTAERPGLRFFVQAHFDVPVDRERISPGSRFNHWVIAQLAPILCEAMRMLKVDAERSALMECLPLQGELEGPLFGGLPHRFQAALGNVPVLRALSGVQLAPASAWVLHETLVPLLRPGQQRVFPTHQLLTPGASRRVVTWILEAGGRTFALEHLIQQLEEDEAGVQLSELLLSGKPVWAGIQPLLEVLGGHPELGRFLLRIRRLRILPDLSGVPRAATELAQGSESIRHVYANSYVVFIHPNLDRMMGAACSAQVSSLLQALELPVLDEASLSSDLSSGRAFNRSVEALVDLHQRLASQLEAFSARLWRTLSLLPIWPDQRGALRPLVGTQRVLLPGRQAVARLFTDAPFLDARVADLPHIQATQLPRVALTQVLLALLPQANPPLRLEPTPEMLKHILGLIVETLEEAGEEVTPTVRSILCTQPFLLSHREHPASLSLLVKVEDPDLAALISEVTMQPLVALGSLSEAVVRDVGLPVRVLDTAGAWTLLLGERDALLAPVRALAVRALLVRDAERLPRGLLLRVLELPIFPAVSGACGPLTGLDGGGVVPTEADWRDSFSSLGVRVLEPASHEALVGALAVAELRPVGLLAFLRFLGGAGGVAQRSTFRHVFETARLDWLHSQLLTHTMLLREHFPAMSREGKPPGNPLLCALPLWRTRAGSLQCADLLLEPPKPELELDFLAQETDVPDEASLEVLRALRPLVPLCPLSIRLQRLLEEQALSLRPIEAQPLALSSPTRLVRVLAHQLVASVREPWHEPPLVLPLLDAQGRLRLDSLKLTDPGTAALLLELHPPGTGGQETQGTTGMLPLTEQLLHPILAEALGNPPPGPLAERLIPLSVRELVQALTSAQVEDEVLPRLWDWLGDSLPRLALDSECKQSLGAAPLFLTAGGRRVRLAALSTDTRLHQAAGLDVRPAPSLSLERVTQLQAMLYPGRRGGAALAVEFLLPTWQERAARGDVVGVNEILILLAGLAEEEGAGFSAQLRKAAKSSNVLLPDELGQWRPLSTILAPDPLLRDAIRLVWGSRCPLVSTELIGDGLGLLRAVLEVPVLPSLEQLRWAGVHARPDLDVRRALCQLVAALASDAEASGLGGSWAGWEILSQQGLPWLLDATGAARAPHDLFASASELEGLIGSAETHPERFVHPELERALGWRGLSQLPLLREQDIRLSHVVAELAVQSSLGHPVGFRIYRWLEAGLREQRLTPSELKQAFKGLAWICTDDGEWFEPARVLGVPAWVCFGRFRGYWQRGIRECPELCALFGIADTLAVDTVTGFLRELGEQVQREGDRLLLGRETALPRMLLACAALLGQHQMAIPDGLPVILAEAMGQPAPGNPAEDSREPPGTRRLLTRSTPGLVRSAAPSLEAIFEQAGRYYRAVLGPPDERDAVEACLERSGVPRLAELLQLELAAEAGQERTQERLQSIRSLRSVLHHVLEVLPRVRRQRSWLEPSGWRYEQRLRLLTLSAPVRVFEGLTVSYLFPGVGRVQVRSAALFEPEWGSSREPLLALDEATIQNPLDTLGELASALVPAVYEGAGSEQLGDILELLLPLGSLERMQHYLDQRHYPVASRQVRPVERLRERLAALVDFGLQRSLTRALPWLGVAAAQEGMNRWGDPDLLSGLEASASDGESSSHARLAMACAQYLMDRSGLAQLAPEPGAARSLEALLAELFLEPDLSRAVSHLWLAGGERPLGDASLSEPDHSLPPHRLGGEDLSFGREFPSDDSSAGEQPSGPGPSSSWWQNLLGGLIPEGSGGGSSSASAAAQGVLRRLGKLLGNAPAGVRREPVADVPVDAAVGGSNPFIVTDRIGDNRWATPEQRRLLGAMPLPAWLRHDPRKLVAPWSYSIRAAGGSFDPASQVWQGVQGVDLLALQQGESSAARVQFEGTFLPGHNLLPLPMFSKLIQAPQVEGATAPPVIRRSRHGGLELDIVGPAPVTVRFQVQLLQPPVLGPGAAERWGSLTEQTLQRLTTPTMPREKLPFRLRRELASKLLMKAPLWERTISALEFARSVTRYDEDWQSQPRVQAVEARLRVGENQHALERFFAGGDTELVGRGICFELNLFLVEVLRCLAVPAMPATGWLLDDGMVGRPDHLFALVILPGPEGPVIMPLDASIGPSGARSALRGVGLKQDRGEERSGPAASSMAAIPLVPVGMWALTAQVRSATALSPGEVQQRLEGELRQAMEEELVVLAEAHALLKRALGTEATARLRETSGRTLQELQELVREERRALEQRVGDGSRAALLLKLVRGELPAMPIVTPEVQELIRMGVARLRTQSLYQVVRVDRG